MDIMTERVYEEGFQPSLQEFKNHLRITSDDLDAVLAPCLLAAISSAEHHIGKDIALSLYTITGNFRHTVNFNSYVMKVELLTVDGKKIDKSYFKLANNALSISPEIEGAEMAITYKAGMNQVPPDIKAAILLTAAKLFNNPVDSVEALPSVAKNLLAPHRSWELNRNGE